jgi:hypothetical protein
MKHTVILIVLILVLPVFCFSQKQLAVGQKITGDFNGDGQVDTALLKVKTNPKTKHKNWILSVSDRTIPSMQIGCCDPILINEGDLNGDKTTELSIFQAPENGCVYMWTTYPFKKQPLDKAHSAVFDCD